jgi:lipopolysaccharide/colanic/teichoic acid biosynthesis glycosyltransferase
MQQSMRRPILIYRENRFMRRLRRVVDCTIAATGLVVAAPVIAAACVAIVLEDGAPVLFVQQRAGRFERMFDIYKLRTMRTALCGDSPSPVDGTDPRLTAVGRFLRKTSIDELPQLFNVLRGDMSIVGPRPEMKVILPRYESWQHLRHLVPPGITCIWQATCRSTIPLDQPAATELDIEYIRRASPLLDGRLLLRTLVSVVFQKGAY